MLILGAVIVGCLLIVVYLLIRSQNKPSLEISLNMPETKPPAPEKAKPAAKS